jgi:SAM-dependent methyltransferase
MYFSGLAMQKVIEMGKSLDKRPKLLDVGCGDCKHSKPFCEAGMKVTGLDIAKPNFDHENFEFKKAYFEYYEWDKSYYDFVWASHILEHTLNPHNFLIHTRQFLKPNGYLAITVPPLKHQIVGGHVNLFNAGLLLYRLVLAQYDCSSAMIHKYGYNISIIVQNRFADFSYNDLKFDCGDIETLSKFFPEGYNYQGFNGDITSLSWE